MSSDVILYHGDTYFECDDCGELLPIDNWQKCSECAATYTFMMKKETDGIPEK